MGKEQCSSYCIFRSSRKATGGFEKKKNCRNWKGWCHDVKLVSRLGLEGLASRHEVEVATWQKWGWAELRSRHHL